MAQKEQRVFKSFGELAESADAKTMADASTGKPLDLDKAAEALDKVLGVALPEGADGEEGVVKDIKNYKAINSAFMRDVEQVEKLFKSLDQMHLDLEKLEEGARRKGFAVGREKEFVIETPPMRDLRGQIAATKKLLDKCNPEALKLVRFRRDHEAMHALVGKAKAIFKSLQNGEKVDEATLKEITKGYADFLHNLLREERIEEVEEDQLREWANKKPKGESFSIHACSWVYRDCRVCDRGRCRTHWFWGINGDDQSIQLARDLRNLNNENSKIRNFLNPRPPRNGKAKPAPQAAAPAITLAPAQTTTLEPSEGSTPVEPENGSIES